LLVLPTVDRLDLGGRQWRRREVSRPGLSVKFFPRSCGWQSIAVNLAPVADDTNNDLF
jgi:hypothetical protein